MNHPDQTLDRVFNEVRAQQARGQQQYIPAADGPTKRSPIVEQFDVLKVELQHLMDALERHEIRLQPVLPLPTPSPCSPPSDQKIASLPPFNIVAELDTAVRVVSAIGSRLKSITERLEV